MTRKATYDDVISAWKELQRYIGSERIAVEKWGKKVRIIREDNSRPFGSDFLTYDQAYRAIWFAINALRLAKVDRISY